MKKTMKSLAALLMAVLMLANITAALAEDTIGTPTDLAPIEVPAEPAEPEVEIIPGTVRIVLRTEGPLYYGDQVTLEAVVSDVEGAFDVAWQIKGSDNQWTTIATGQWYTFILTEANAATEYRAVVTTAE